MLTLKTQRRRLEDHQKRVMFQIDRESEVARHLVASGRKDRALLALKKRRLHQTTLGQLDAWLLNVESTVRLFVLLVEYRASACRHWQFEFQ